jgi:iron complex outermembrane recepter protein
MTTMVCRLGVRLTVGLASVALFGLATESRADEASAQVPAGEESAAPASEAAPADTSRRRESIEEIVVSARRRDENLQETPISITAFNGRDLQEQGIARLDDIGKFSPNLQFESAAFSPTSARIQIRGIGNGDPIANRDPGVGIYLDGVYLARAQGQLLGLADIERVEVLRGPQGTLFGRNTIGGAVSITSVKPSDEFGVDTTIRVGNYDLFESRISVNVPLVPERAALRASFQTITRDGYTENRQLGKDTDDRKLLGGRIALRLTPSDTVEVMLTGEQTRTHVGGRGGECRFNPEAVPLSPLFTGPGAEFLDFQASCQESEADDELDYRSPINSFTNLDTWGLGSTLTWDVSDTVAFKSITSWRRQENDSNDDFSYGRVNVGNVVTGTDQQDQVSQEFNLSGTWMDGRLNVTGGLFAFYEKTTPTQPTTTFVAFRLCNDPAFAQQIANQLGLPVELVLPAVQADACDPTFEQRAAIRTLARAAYAQATFDVTDRLHVTAGLRRSLESKEFKQSQRRRVTPTTFGPTFLTNQTDRFDAWTPSFTAGFDVAEDMLLYATYSKGFKSGGFNGRPSPAVDGTLAPFKQEILNNYEIGLKASFFDKRLVANIALFDGIYDDIQQTILSVDPGGISFASSVVNAAKAEIRGAEIELRAIPFAGLDLSVALGFTDAEYEDFEDLAQQIDPATGMVFEDAMGNPALLPRDRSDEGFFATPNFTATFGVGYTLPSLPIGDLTARLNWYHSNALTYSLVSDTLRQGTYGLLSGRLALALPDGKTEIALFGENLLDRRFINSGINFEDGFAVSLAYYGAPRMYGIEIRRSF